MSRNHSIPPYRPTPANVPSTKPLTPFTFACAVVYVLLLVFVIAPLELVEQIRDPRR